ncbi:sorbosone dehydrogenase [Novimethylophilus kurashikiensis]|uniref:Sorbosone dehydrogenase n=1 Tax=Novimethylophilus kurashikiensis TaxID=1825523 RepID=A0A2R5F726_9PROT|nr:SH3 domain-containing protein [Novimethylophilus kurashikiensis]GBG13348.1 sorbosone dehydrogenase [Novimethylophilus kurashikiensis]
MLIGISACKNQATAEGVETFPGLRALHIKNADVTLYYDPKISTVLSGNHPEAKNYEEAGVFISRPLRTQLLGLGKGFFTIDCDSGGSWDPGCTFLLENEGKLKKVFQTLGLRFALPGNGNIYVEGHNDTMFNVRKKYGWHDGKCIEIKQPFNFVGLDTTTREPIELFSSQEYKQIVATLPKGSPVTVLLNEGEHYLVKTPFGLLGWVKIRDGVQQAESPIAGIYFAGD